MVEKQRTCVPAGLHGEGLPSCRLGGVPEAAVEVPSRIKSEKWDRTGDKCRVSEALRLSFKLQNDLRAWASDGLSSGKMQGVAGAGGSLG